MYMSTCIPLRDILCIWLRLRLWHYALFTFFSVKIAIGYLRHWGAIWANENICICFCLIERERKRRRENRNGRCRSKGKRRKLNLKPIPCRFFKSVRYVDSNNQSSWRLPSLCIQNNWIVKARLFLSVLFIADTEMYLRRKYPPYSHLNVFCFDSCSMLEDAIWGSIIISISGVICMSNHSRYWYDLQTNPFDTCALWIWV